MREGMYLGRPPIDVGVARASAVLHTMLRGSGSYGAAAGGWPDRDKLALPQLQPALKPTPASPAYDVDGVAFYSLTPAQFKLDLRKRFGRPIGPKPGPGSFSAIPRL